MPKTVLAVFVGLVVLSYIYIIFIDFFLVKSTQLAIQKRTKSSVVYEDLSLVTKIPKYNLQKKAELGFFSSLQQLTAYLDQHGWPLIITMSTGRLGNNIHNYALNLVLQQQFPNASYAVSHQLYTYVRTVFAEETLVLPVITYGHSIFDGYEEFLFNTLRLRDDLKQKATNFLKKTELTFRKERNVTDVTFVGVHIRRGDYVRRIRVWLRVPSLPGRTFYRKAFGYYKKCLKHPVFVVTSDDPQYVKHAFRKEADVVFSGNRTAAEDFAILACCSHSIMTVGSFGFWASFFAGGRVLFSGLKNSAGFESPSLLEMNNAFPNFWWYSA